MKNFEKVYILVNDMNQDMIIKYNNKYNMSVIKIEDG